MRSEKRHVPPAVEAGGDAAPMDRDQAAAGGARGA